VLFSLRDDRAPAGSTIFFTPFPDLAIGSGDPLFPPSPPLAYVLTACLNSPSAFFSMFMRCDPFFPAGLVLSPLFCLCHNILSILPFFLSDSEFLFFFFR